MLVSSLQNHSSVLEKRYAYSRAYASLQRTLQMWDEHPEVREALTMGLIKNFDLAYETCLQLLQKYLSEEKSGKMSAENVFALCAERGMLPGDLADELCELIRLRKRSEKAYEPEIAEKLAADVLKHAPVFTRISAIITEGK